MKNTLNKGKAVCFAVHSLILYQYPIDLLTFLELYLESSKYFKGKFRLAGTICQSNFVLMQRSRKATHLCERNENTFTLNSYYIYPCSCFHFIVNEISPIKMKNCPRRLTAMKAGVAKRDPGLVWSHVSWTFVNLRRGSLSCFHLTDLC